MFKYLYSPSTCGVVFFGKPNDIPGGDYWTINNHSHDGFSPNRCRNFILNFPQTSDRNWPCIYGRSVITGVWGQTPAEQAKCATTASTTSLHPAFTPPIQALCKSTPQGHAKWDLQCTQRGSVDEWRDWLDCWADITWTVGHNILSTK